MLTNNSFLFHNLATPKTLRTMPKSFTRMTQTPTMRNHSAAARRDQYGHFSVIKSNIFTNKRSQLKMKCQPSGASIKMESLGNDRNNMMLGKQILQIQNNNIEQGSKSANFSSNQIPTSKYAFDMQNHGSYNSMKQQFKASISQAKSILNDSLTKASQHINQKQVHMQMIGGYRMPANNKRQRGRSNQLQMNLNQSSSDIQMNAAKSSLESQTEVTKIDIQNKNNEDDMIDGFQDQEFSNFVDENNNKKEDLKDESNGSEKQQISDEQDKSKIPSYKKKITTKKMTKRPEKILVFAKAFDDAIIPDYKVLHQYITKTYPDIEVFTEKWLVETVEGQVEKTPSLWNNQDEEERDMIDMIIVMGGDGTVLWASKQFRYGSIPPILSFSMGSYGYLCNFHYEDHQQVIDSVIGLDDQINLDERLRIKATMPEEYNIRQIYRGNDMESKCAIEIKDYHIFNEVVIDRGPSPFAIQVEIYFDGEYMTTMVGDGLIVATPTGSTAYNLSAGGSIVQSNTDCLCVTPLAPHSLSFRPVIIPASTRITLRKPKDNRNSAWVSLDGATRFELKDGEEIDLEASETKLSVITDQSQLMKEWGQRLNELLNWNQRQPQKAFTRKITGNASEKEDDNDPCCM